MVLQKIDPRREKKSGKRENGIKEARRKEGDSGIMNFERERTVSYEG